MKGKGTGVTKRDRGTEDEKGVTVLVGPPIFSSDVYN